MKVKLIDICDFQGGSQPPKDEWKGNYINGYIRMLQIRDFTQKNKVIPEYVKISNSLKFCEADDILIARYGASVGKILTGLSGAYNVAIMKIIPDTTRLNKRYLKYFLESRSFQDFIKNVGSRAAQAGFNKSDLSSIFIEERNINEQNKIINILDKLTSLIELKKNQLEKMNLFVKSLFIEMFGDPWINNKNYTIDKLKNYCILNPLKEKNIKKDELCSFIGMASITENGDINTNNIKKFLEVSKGFTYFLENDVLFAKITPCMENGKGAIAQNLCNGIGAGSTEFHVLRPLTNKSNPYWLYILTTLKHFRILAEKNMTGSAGQRRVPISFLENFQLPIPPIELQENFAKKVQQIDKSKLAIQQSLEQLETLKKSLMQEYFC